MEIDELKYIWKQVREELPVEEGEERLLVRLRRKSRDPVSAMKRNLLWETLLALLLYLPLIAGYLAGFHGKLKEVAWFLVMILALFLLYYYRKYRLLLQMGPGAFTVKEQLEKRLSSLQSYLRFYRLTGLMIPICILFLAGLMYWKLPAPLHQNLFYRAGGQGRWQPAIWVAILLIASLLVYFTDGWYLKKLYGRHVVRLKRILDEMSRT